MFRRIHLRFCAPAAAIPVRALDSAALLDVIAEDPGETARYYATRYFGGAKNEKIVVTLLWNDLKKYGFVDMDRGDSTTALAKWFPRYTLAKKGPRVKRYRAEDYDLSVLPENEDTQQEQELLKLLRSSDPVKIESPAATGWASVSQFSHEQQYNTWAKDSWTSPFSSGSTPGLARRRVRSAW